MTTADLNAFLSNKISSADLRAQIDNDVDRYALLLNKKGSSIQLNIFDDEPIIISKTKIKRLLNETVNTNLTPIHLAYICDCLTMVEYINFESEEIEDVVFSIADPEINGGFKTTEDLKEIIQELS